MGYNVTVENTTETALPYFLFFSYNQLYRGSFIRIFYYSNTVSFHHDNKLDESGAVYLIKLYQFNDTVQQTEGEI